LRKPGKFFEKKARRPGRRQQRGCEAPLGDWALVSGQLREALADDSLGERGAVQWVFACRLRLSEDTDRHENTPLLCTDGRGCRFRVGE
jgi:hypothetical protein